MTISPQEVQQILSEQPYEKFIPFEECTHPLDKKPSYKEIESHFGHVMMDLELTGENKLQVLQIPKEERWEFYCEQVKDDAEIPSPIYLIDCIKKKHNPRLLESLAAQFSKYRISYRQQFIDGGGLQLLFNYLRKFSEDPNSDENQESMPYVFTCLSNIANSLKFGSSFFENDIDEIFSILFDIMTKSPFNKNFMLILSIITGCFISPKDGPDLPIIIKTVKILKLQPPLFWKNLKKAVYHRNSNDLQMLNKFTQLLLLLRNNPKERIDVVIMFATNGYMDSIRELSDSMFSNSLSQYNSDYELIAQFSKSLEINPFSIKSLLKGLKENSKQKTLFRSILLSLNDILKNYESTSNNQGTYVFLHNFLFLHRHYLSQDNKTNLESTAVAATTNSDPIKIPYQGHNLGYRQLNDKGLFLNDSILKSSDLSNYAKVIDRVHDDKQIPALNKKIEEYKAYADKIKDAHHVANAVHFEQGLILSQLKSLRTENIHLRSLADSLTEKLKKYEKGEENSFDQNDQISIQKHQIELLKQKIQNLESQIQQENQKYQSINRQLEQSRNIIQDLRNKDESKSKDSEIENLKTKLHQSQKKNENLASKMNSVSNDLKKLNSTISEINSQLEVTNNEKENLKIKVEHSNKVIEYLKSQLYSNSSIDVLKLSQLDLSNNGSQSLSLTNEGSDINLKSEESQKTDNSIIDTKNPETQALLNEIQSLKSKLEDAEKEIESLRSQLEESKTIETQNSEKLTKEIESLKMDLQISSSEIDNLKNDLIISKNESENLMSQLNESKSNENPDSQELINEVQDLKSKLEKSESEIEILRSKIDESQTSENQDPDSQDEASQIQILKLKLNESEREIEKLRLQIDELKRIQNHDPESETQKDELETENEVLKKQREVSEPSNKEGQIPCSNLTLSANNYSDSEVKLSDDENEEGEKSIEQKLEDSLQTNKELQTKLVKSSTENEELQTKIEQLNNEIEELKKAAQNSEKKNNQTDPLKNTNLDENESELESYRKRVSELELQLQKLTETTENLKKRLELSESENDRLRHEEIDTLKAQLKPASSTNGNDADFQSMSSANFDSTDFLSPSKAKPGSFTQNSLILSQLDSQQQQIELLRKMLAEYESKDWGLLNPSYDLKNANSDEIDRLREELKNTQEQLEQYKAMCNGEASSDGQIIEVLKEQLNEKKAEIEELKLQLKSIEKQFNELKGKSNNSDTNNNKNDSESNNKQDQAKKKFSFKNMWPQKQ